MSPRTLLDELFAAFRKALPDVSRLPDAVWKRTGALNTWGTNALEGNTLTPAEVERLLLDEKSISGRPVPDVLETLQHEAAFRGLLARRDQPLTLVVVQELHEEVFRGIPGYRPGQWRSTNPYIGGTRYRPPRREKVVGRLEAWIREHHRRDRQKGKVLSTAAWSHHEFESIHPFENGNGRVGRLVLNLHFLRHGWPPTHLGPEDRPLYLKALEEGHKKDYAPLEDLLRDSLTRSLLDLLDQLGGPQDRLQPLAEFDGLPWNPYKAHYLALRARQGALGAIHVRRTSAPVAARRVAGRGRYLTSERALRSYLAHTTRSDVKRRIRHADRKATT